MQLDSVVAEDALALKALTCMRAVVVTACVAACGAEAAPTSMHAMAAREAEPEARVGSGDLNVLGLSARSIRGFRAGPSGHVVEVGAAEVGAAEVGAAVLAVP